MKTYDQVPVVGEVVLNQDGTFRRIRQYLAGWHPERGVLHFGWSGRETIVERDVISPIHPVHVVLVGGSED